MEQTITPEIEILNLFNAIAGKRHKPSKSNLSGIKRVLKEGYTIEQITEVIQIKTLEWKNNVVMSTNLNPVTVFRDCNFDKYINQVLTIKENPQLYAEHYATINKVSSGNNTSRAFDKIDAMFGKR